MKSIAQLTQDGFCFSVGTFSDDHVLRENEIDVTDNPSVTGMYYRDGAWVAADEPEPAPTQLDNIEQTQLVMMEAMADQYEESQERDLTSMEVQATIYEEILALKGEV